MNSIVAPVRASSALRHDRAGARIFAPTPSTINPEPSWRPQAPIDIRDVIHVPKGQLAPWGYQEYLPDGSPHDRVHPSADTIVGPRFPVETPYYSNTFGS